MKICVLGLDCAAPEILLKSNDLPNIRGLMQRGAWGRLESVIPPITVPAWMCLSTSQDPGSLGVYGFRNRANQTYGGLAITDSTSIQTPAIWDYLGEQGKKSVIVGVPPGFPPRKINGISVGCFLTPDSTTDEFTHPAEIKKEINQLVGDYPTDVAGFRTDKKEWLRDQIFEMSRKQWDVVRHFLRTKEWDYFHFVDIGLDRVHHGFWDSYDKQHIHYKAGNPYESVIPDYYRHLDEQIGSTLELLDNARCCVRRSVVRDDHLEARVVLPHRACESLGNKVLLHVSDDHQRDQRSALVRRWGRRSRTSARS